MKRRSFFTALGTIVAGAIAPALFLPQFEPVQWKPLRSQWRIRPSELINPEMPWVFRQYGGKWDFVMQWHRRDPAGLWVPVGPSLGFKTATEADLEIGT